MPDFENLSRPMTIHMIQIDTHPSNPTLFKPSNMQLPMGRKRLDFLHLTLLLFVSEKRPLTLIQQGQPSPQTWQMQLVPPSFATSK